jgi:hypothetical protein
MTRKMMVKLIACLTIAKGIWDIGTFIYPFFFLPEPVPIKVYSFLGGVLEIFAGMSLFDLSEAGRKFFLFVAYISTIPSAFFSTLILSSWKDSYASSINFWGKFSFESENRFLTAGILAVFFLIPVLVIIFLSQQKTKELFSKEMISMIDSTTSSGTK